MLSNGGSQIYVTSDGGSTTTAYYKPTSITLSKGSNTITIDATANSLTAGTIIGNLTGTATSASSIKNAPA